MKFLFILDPYASLKLVKDTSVAMMREAAAQGHQLFVCQQQDIFLRHDVVHLKTQAFSFSNAENWYALSEITEQLPTDFDAIIMRKDPPFDNEYLYSTYLLELANKQGGYVINNPITVRSWNEKLSVARFPQFCPAFLVTSQADLIIDFLNKQQEIVVKPLDGMGGASIFRLTKNDLNLNVILETITHFGKQTIMAQQYLPAITQGDKRIIVIDGNPLPYALARIPKAGETRGNLAAGGKGVVRPLSTRDLEIATTIGKTLKEEGLFFVGLDVIGDYLTEINVTSPTGIVEIAAQTNCKPAQIFLNALISKLESKSH
ncbi:MAG: glutathione synthase [Methylophilaceae bacterium]|nr:MAG: glutathione synthase [Methylophilaceae bacterium]